VYMEHQITALSRYLCVSCSKYCIAKRTNVCHLTVVKILSSLIVCSYKQSHCYDLLSGVFQQHGTAIRTSWNVGVARNCVVQDRWIFVMYKAENSYNKTYG
jgi:hypothetical protein